MFSRERCGRAPVQPEILLFEVVEGEESLLCRDGPTRRMPHEHDLATFLALRAADLEGAGQQRVDLVNSREATTASASFSYELTLSARLDPSSLSLGLTPLTTLACAVRHSADSQFHSFEIRS